MYSLETQIEFDSQKDANIFYESIKPELTAFKRSQTKVKVKKAFMDIKINASDKTAMRASLNSVVKPLILFTQMEEIK